MLKIMGLRWIGLIAAVLLVAIDCGGKEEARPQEQTNVAPTSATSASTPATDEFDYCRDSHLIGDLVRHVRAETLPYEELIAMANDLQADVGYFTVGVPADQDKVLEQVAKTLGDLSEALTKGQLATTPQELDVRQKTVRIVAKTLSFKGLTAALELGCQA